MLRYSSQTAKLKRLPRAFLIIEFGAKTDESFLYKASNLLGLEIPVYIVFEF